MFPRVQSVEPNSYNIDYGSPLAYGLVAAYPGASDLNLVTGRRASRIGTASNLQPFQTTLGKATRFNGGSAGGGSAYEDSSIPYYDKNWTVVAIVRSNGSAIIPIVSYGGAFNAGNHGWNFEITNGTWFRYSNGNGGSYDLTASGAGWPIANEVTVAGLACYDNGTSLSMDLYLDGIRRGGAGAAYPLSPNTDPFRIGAKSSDGATGMTYVQGDSTPQSPTIGLVLFWNRKLSADEMKAITANPWQIFKANPKLQSQYGKITPPNPDTLIKYAIGYENSTYFNNVTPSSGQGVSNRHPGYNFSNSWYNSWGSPTSTALTVAPAAGDFVFLTIVTTVGASGAASAVVDNAGGVWTNIVNAEIDGNNNRYSYWYCNNIQSGTTTITATFTGGYPSSVKMVAASYKNMTGATLNNYSPMYQQVNPGAGTDAIKSNTAFYNASTYNSSNGSGLIVSTNNALVIGVTYQWAGGGTYTAGSGYKIRRSYSGIVHQDAEYNGMANTQTIINATDSSGGTNTYTTYGFAFDQPIVSSTWYTAKYGDTITRVRFRASGANGAIARVSLRRVDTNQIIYTTQEFTLTSSATHTAWEIPVAWPLIPGVTYALSLYSVSGTVNISYNDAIGESSHGSQYAVGSTWDDSVVYGDYNADRRYVISGDITKRLYMNYRTSGTVHPASSTATTGSFDVEKGDLILVRCVFPSNPTGVTISDTAGNFYHLDRYSGNGAGSAVAYMFSVKECVASQKNNQITINNTSALTPNLIQYSVYSSSHPWENISDGRGVVYSLGYVNTGEVAVNPAPNKSMQLVVMMGDSGNNTTTGDYVYGSLTNQNVRQKELGVAGSIPASTIYDVLGRAAANSAGGSYEAGNYGDPALRSSLGATNGVTYLFSSLWQYASGPHTYRQAVGSTNAGTITMMPTRERSLVLVFMSGVSNVLGVSDNKGTVYSRYVDQANNAGIQIFYGYPQAGMTTITPSGGNSQIIAIEEPEMALIPLQAYDSSYRDGFYYNASSVTHAAARTTFPDIIYLQTNYGFGRRPIRTVDSNTLYPVLTTNPPIFPRSGTDSGGVDVFTGIHYYEYGDSYHDVFRAELDSPRSNNNFTLESIMKYVDNFQGNGASAGNITRYLMSVALKKPQLMLGPDISKWGGFSQFGGYITNGGTNTSGAVHVSGYLARFSGWTTTITIGGTGPNYSHNQLYLAIYDSDGKFVAKSAEVADTYYTYQSTTDVYGRIVLPITAYLEKGKRYYLAFFISNSPYYQLASNPNPSTSINDKQWAGLDTNSWTYSYATPPAIMTEMESISGSTTNFAGAEFAIWVDGVPTYSRLNSDGTYESANLIESYE